MASVLLSEILERIFSNLIEESFPSNPSKSTSTKSLYSCTLVSRHWCRVSTPFLYSYPFHHFRHLSSKTYSPREYDNYYKLIRTLLSCIPKSEINKYTGFKNDSEKSSNISPAFNYISFIRGLIVDKLMIDSSYTCRYKEIWKSKNSQEERIMKYFVMFLFKHCDNLTTLEFSHFIEDHNLYDNVIDSLTLESRNGRSKIRDLEELHIRSSPGFTQLYSTFSKLIPNLRLLCNHEVRTIREAKPLANFISSQKNLQHIILLKDEKGRIENEVNHNNRRPENCYNVVFRSLSTQKDWLQILEFRYLSFDNLTRHALNSLSLLVNLRELKLIECKNTANLVSWANSLTKLETIEFESTTVRDIPVEFLTELFRSSSDTLTKLVLDYNNFQYFQLTEQIARYLHSLTYLVFPEMYPTELMTIFKSCGNLTYLSVIFSTDVNATLEKLRIFVPDNLKSINVRDKSSLRYEIFF